MASTFVHGAILVMLVALAASVTVEDTSVKTVATASIFFAGEIYALPSYSAKEAKKVKESLDFGAAMMYTRGKSIFIEFKVESHKEIGFVRKINDLGVEDLPEMLEMDGPNELELEVGQCKDITLGSTISELNLAIGAETPQFGANRLYASVCNMPAVDHEARRTGLTTNERQTYEAPQGCCRLGFHWSGLFRYCCSNICLFAATPIAYINCCSSEFLIRPCE